MENNSAKTTIENQPHAHHLSHKETRQIVTPYAFHVSPELFGTALARPKKRALAIGIDLLLVAILSQSASFILAGVAAVTFFRAGNRLKLKKRFNTARLGLRFGAAALLFVFALGLFNEFEDEGYENNSESSVVTGVSGIAMAAITTKYMLEAGTLVDEIDQEKCQPALQCWQILGDEFVTALSEVPVAEQQVSELTRTFLELAEEQLSAAQKERLISGWLQHIQKNKLTLPALKNTLKNSEDTVASAKQQTDKPLAKKDEPKVGVIAWTKSLIEDLGLGFGWAAFYFSIFTGWWKGQTPGKKLLGIKVIKLDGSTPSLWESFGRYGGYGAGFATGLLGFLQVYWDPNRQAIQDKISETLVIDLRIAKVPFTPEQDQQTQVVLSNV